MFRKRLRLGGVGVLFLLFFLRVAPANAQIEERLVLAFYYAWFDMMTWEQPLSDKPAQLYHSSDVAAIQRHALLAHQAGVDALVQAWYGPTLANNQTESNFRILLDQAQMAGIHAAVSVDMGGPFLQSQEEVSTALQALWQGHTQHAAYLRVQGRPVVFFWRQNNFSVATWRDIRAQVDPERAMLWIAEGAQPEYLEVFDGLYLYSVAWSADPAAVLVRWGNVVDQWSAESNAFRYWVATVMPGYNDLVTGRSDAFVRDRAEGAYYRACWAGAVQSEADWVVITSFNEWLEGTHIEPSVNYGDVYLNLTTELAAGYRNASFLPLPTSTPELPTATLTPVIATLPVITATQTPVVEMPTMTPTLNVTPTATLTPTATPFRLATPTPYLSPTAPPRASPTPRPAMTPTTAVGPRSLTPVEGSSPKMCSLLPALLPLVGLLVVRIRRRLPL